MHVPLTGLVSEFADRVADLIQRQMMHRPSFGDDVLLDH